MNAFIAISGILDKSQIQLYNFAGDSEHISGSQKLSTAGKSEPYLSMTEIFPTNVVYSIEKGNIGYMPIGHAFG